MAELGKVSFLGCTHGSIWALDNQDGACRAKKVGLSSLKKIEWTHINEPLVELIYNLNYDDQYIKLQG